MGAGLAMNSRMHSPSVLSNSKYGKPVPSVRRRLLSEGHFRRMAGVYIEIDVHVGTGPGRVVVGHFPIKPSVRVLRICARHHIISFQLAAS